MTTVKLDGVIGYPCIVDLIVVVVVVVIVVQQTCFRQQSTTEFGSRWNIGSCHHITVEEDEKKNMCNKNKDTHRHPEGRKKEERKEVKEVVMKGIKCSMAKQTMDKDVSRTALVCVLVMREGVQERNFK